MKRKRKKTEPVTITSSSAGTWYGLGTLKSYLAMMEAGDSFFIHTSGLGTSIDWDALTRKKKKKTKHVLEGWE